MSVPHDTLLSPPLPQPICKLNGEDSEGLEIGEATNFLEIAPAAGSLPIKF